MKITKMETIGTQIFFGFSITNHKTFKIIFLNTNFERSRNSVRFFFGYKKTRNRVLIKPEIRK